MKRRHKKKIPLVSYLFILPALILNLMFFVFPFLQSLLMSFYDWPVLGEKTFVFLDNYIKLFQDAQFWNSLLFTMKYAVFVTPCLFILAFILGGMIEKNLRRGFSYSTKGFITFLTRPVSLLFLVIAVLSLVIPIVKDLKKMKAQKEE